MIDWQPIETAPKDGTKVLVYVLENVGWWRSTSSCGSEKLWWEPTHWAVWKPPMNNPPRAAKRGRGRPEKQIEPDFGPAEGLLAGRVLLGYRTDPEAPSAPAIRAARRKVIYHQLWVIGFLADEHHEAADRYLHRLEVAGGAKVGVRGSGGGYGPTMGQVAALADLRLADDAIGPALVHDVRQVIGWNLWPERLAPEALRDALGRMAAVWGM